MKKVVIGINSTEKWRFMPSTHAEIDAYQKIKNCRNNPRQLDLMVIRITKTGLLAQSRPCFHCIDILSKSRLNIKNVYYTTNNGQIVCETFSEMALNPIVYITRGFRRK